MPATTTSAPWLNELLAIIRQHWGFSALRPLQQQSMQTVLEGRDSLLVLPTGGGKSLCYQAPAVYRNEPTVVISPLIALMKDQVDGLKANGIHAVQLNSSMSQADIREAEQAVLQGQAKLVFASPERMATPGFRTLLKQARIRTFAIDEAHCISHWGHDFRPDYRQLSQLKELFPDASVHAFTATATEQVRQDIVEQLALRNAEVLVGNFDRPNLTYRIIPKHDVIRQALACVKRHPGEAGIIYCIRRKDVDELTSALQAAKLNALPYHAGLSPEERIASQNAFIAETCDIVVATVAFGMGIDRSNIRYVLHTGLPKSIEHYQQETGRAGRDGLEAECVLLFSVADVMTWRSIMDKSISESGMPVDPEFLRNAQKHLNDMERYCRPTTCRHRSLVEYFGQTLPGDNCGACDLCLGDAEVVPDAETISKKILSCVFRVKEGFGANHVIDVLRGADTDSIRKWGHESLTTYGLLKEHSKSDLRNWIDQLVGQGALEVAGGDRPILRLNTVSWEVMKDRQPVKLLRLPGGPEGEKKKSKADAVSWTGVDRELFEKLRDLRRTLATERNVPPYLVFGDATLRELARCRPSTLPKMLLIYGVGDAKLNDFGAAFLSEIDRQSQERNLTRDVDLDDPAADVPSSARASRAARAAALREEEPEGLTGIQELAATFFRQGMSIEEVMAKMSRARSTTVEYLAAWIRLENPTSVAPWISNEVLARVEAVARTVGMDKLKPLFVALNEEVPYDVLRIAVSHLSHRTPT